MMRTLVIYDSAYGNTSRVARAIEKELSRHCESRMYLIADAPDGLLKDIDLLVVGSPTQAGRATQGMQDYIKALPELNGLKVATFDTRYDKDEHGFKLKILMSTIGFAASKMAAALTAKGGNLASYPEGFIVNDKEGPLKEGELARAKQWALELAESL